MNTQPPEPQDPRTPFERAADEVDKIIESHMFVGWANDGPSLSRDEVNDLLDRLGAKIREALLAHPLAATSKEPPPRWRLEDDKFDDPPACPGCGAMAGACSDYPSCPGGQSASKEQP